MEEERRAAEQKRVREERLAEQRRIQEARATAQKQAEQRKLDEQRLHAAQEKARAEQLTAAIEQEKQEKLRAQSHYPRADVQGTLRQLAQKEVARPALQNKSSKRALMDTDDESRPALQRGPASYQQQDNKRRKTLEEEEVGGHERHSVMAPPKRPSNMRKVCCFLDRVCELPLTSMSRTHRSLLANSLTATLMRLLPRHTTLKA